MGEIVRAGLREVALTKRKESRTLTWSKSRTNLGEYPRDELFSAEYINEKTKLLKKNRISQEDYRYLPNALIQSEENINTFLKVDQSLSSLVSHLSGNNQTLQLYAANCCCNISLGNTKACATLGKAIGSYLVAELETFNYALLDVCVWTIGNLIAGSKQAFSILHSQHCLKYLMLLLHKSDHSILSSVMYALLHYVHVGFYEIPGNQLAEVVQIMIKQNLLYQSVDSIWLLALLSSSAICTAYLYSILSQIVDYLHSTFLSNDKTSEITASIRILANTMHNVCEDKVDILLRNPKYSQEDLHLLLNKLLRHQYMHIRRETLWLIGNLYNHSSSNVSANVRDLIEFLPGLSQAFLSIKTCA